MSSLLLSLSMAVTHGEELWDKSAWQTPPTDSNGFSREVPCILLTSQSVSPQGSWNQFVARNLVSLVLLLDFQIYCDNFFQIRWHDHNCFWFWDLVKPQTDCAWKSKMPSIVLSWLESFCVQNQLSQSGWMKTLIPRLRGRILPFAWDVCRNPDSVVYYARKQRKCFLCIESSVCLTDAPGISFWRIRKTAIGLAAHGRQTVLFPQETV